MTAYQNLGFDNNNHIAGFGWGALYDQRNAQVRFSQDISKAFGYDISLVQPEYYTDNGTRPGQPLQPINPLALSPWPLQIADELWHGIPDAGRLVQYVKWNDLPARFKPDDNMTSWAAVLPVVVKAGAFTGTFQGAYGHNMGRACRRVALQSAYHGYGRDP